MLHRQRQNFTDDIELGGISQRAFISGDEEITFACNAELAEQGARSTELEFDKRAGFLDVLSRDCFDRFLQSCRAIDREGGRGTLRMTQRDHQKDHGSRTEQESDEFTNHKDQCLARPRRRTKAATARSEAAPASQRFRCEEPTPAEEGFISSG
ncbi:unannotated protein [freshwater metagenome]|uniref:Unannotated protein n=1 Tax=freshwater metagenome TaxID=449393 RepID=A0A6J6ZWI0_9ZZZZ